MHFAVCLCLSFLVPSTFRWCLLLLHPSSGDEWGGLTLPEGINPVALELRRGGRGVSNHWRQTHTSRTDITPPLTMSVCVDGGDEAAVAALAAMLLFVAAEL